MQEDYPRNFTGYGGQPPKVQWPNNCRLAISFVLNYEEGAEACRLDGDPSSESFLTDIPGTRPLSSARHFNGESIFAYGATSGAWRLLNLFDDFSLPVTVFACGMALERNLPLAQKLAESDHEIAGHGYRWIDYRVIPIAIEKSHIRKTLEIIENLTHKQVVGWHTGRQSENTRRLVQEMGLLYDSDAYNDDLPYYIDVAGQAHLVVPYSLVTNDFRYSTTPGWNSPDDCLQNLRAAFDCLYREGEETPKMLSIGLHGRLSGQPGRTEALRRFLDYALSHEDVWVCRRMDIARHWLAHHPSHHDQDSGGSAQTSQPSELDLSVTE